MEDVVADDNYVVDPASPRPGNEDSNNNVTVTPVHIPNININASIDDFGIDIYLC